MIEKTIRLPFRDNSPTARLLYGQDVRASLRSLPDKSVHSIMTSPPYYGLRDYGADGQIGLEETPDEFVAALVDVFREARRVLRDDGTLWVNLGDSYNAAGRSTQGTRDGYKQGTNAGSDAGQRPTDMGLKPKDLIGIPWRVAFALQADGWYLRQDIIWQKNNPMPESVADRCTKSHEYVFLFSKKPSYFYDSVAIREPCTPESVENFLGRTVLDNKTDHGGSRPDMGNKPRTAYHRPDFTRNKRSVWTVNTKPYSGAHFAVWPPELVRSMILAGTSTQGVCEKCGDPWVRKIGRPCRECGGFIPRHGHSCPECGFVNDWKAERGLSDAFGTTDWSTPGKAVPRKLGASGHQGAVPPQETIDDGWEASCECGAGVVPATVLDTFSGSATTGMVALEEGRNYIGLDLNPEYLPLAESRVIGGPPPQRNQETDSAEGSILDLFGEG